MKTHRHQTRLHATLAAVRDAVLLVSLLGLAMWKLLELLTAAWARVLLVVFVCGGVATPARPDYRTANFVVRASIAEWEQYIGDKAEAQRKELAELWLGQELPTWETPCVVRVELTNKAPSGSTAFVFEHGLSRGFDMHLSGTAERVLDSVLPHELTHVILATRFGTPVPRWVDEGAACTVEHPDERLNWEQSIVKCLKSQRGIGFKQLFAFTEYPPDHEAFYAHSYSVSSWLILQRGHRDLVCFVERAFETQSWRVAAKEIYGFDDLLAMQNAWVAWLKETPGPVRYTVGKCGSCFGGACQLPQSGWQPAARVIRVQPQQLPPPSPQPKPAQPPAGLTPADVDSRLVPLANKIDELGKLSVTVAEAVNNNRCDCRPTDLAPISAKLDLILAAVNAKPTPPPQQSHEQHVVIVADHNSPYWQRLAEAIADARKTYSGIMDATLPTFPIGTHPQAVIYRDSVPVRIVKGQYEVEALLSRLARGEPI